MSQEVAVLYLTMIYIFSSWIGAILFSVVWRLTHADRAGLVPPVGEDEARRYRLRKAAAWRNEVVAGVMAFAFWLYAIAGAIAGIRLLGIADLPWTEGLVTTTLLVAGNFVEMTIGISLLLARRAMNRGGNS